MRVFRTTGPATLLSAFLLILLPACTKSKIVAKVGEYEISQKDVELRDKVVRIYYPGEQRSVGLKQLVEAYQAARILKKYGRPVTAEILEAEATRIDRNTKSPEGLGEIKAIFAGDSESYRRIYVLPVFVNRTLRFDLFPQDQRIHAESLEKARTFVAVATAQNFRKAGEAAGGKFATFEITRDEIKWKSDLPPPPPGSPDSSEIVQKLAEERKTAAAAEATLWVDRILKDLKPGQIYSEVVDQNEKWLVARYVKKLSGERHAMEAILFPKQDYGTWLAAERQSLD